MADGGHIKSRKNANMSVLDEDVCRATSLYEIVCRLLTITARRLPACNVVESVATIATTTTVLLVQFMLSPKFAFFVLTLTSIA